MFQAPKKNIKVSTDDMGREYTTRRRLTPSSYDVLLDSIDVHILLNKLELLGVKKSNKTSK